jgi:hypothetical protein
MVSFYLARSGKAAIEKLAVRRKATKADTYRALLAYAVQHMPRDWKP